MGFSVSDTHRGFGLESITTRTHELGGVAEIVSEGGNGTKIEVTVPVAVAKSLGESDEG